MRSMAEIVRSRLDELGLNPFEAARRAGLEKGFVNDLLTGRKHSVRGQKLGYLAVALECDPEYLTGHQSAPRSSRSSSLPHRETVQSLPLGGIIEAGTWREVAIIGRRSETVPTSPDHRFPADAQTAYLVRGPGAGRLGIDDGAIVVGCSVEAFEETTRRLRDGDAVIVRRWRADRSEVEQSIRIVNGHDLAPAGEGMISISRAGDETEIVGVVIRTIRIFGLTT